MTGRTGVVFADDDYMETAFGVSLAQSANSRFGLAPFDADGGLKNGLCEPRRDVQPDRTVRATRGRRLLAAGRATRPTRPSRPTPTSSRGYLGAAYRFQVLKLRSSITDGRGSAFVRARAVELSPLALVFIAKCPVRTMSPGTGPSG